MLQMILMALVQALSQKYFALIDCTQWRKLLPITASEFKKASFTLLQKLSGNR